ncbi:MAG: PIG-L deacetylase family protein [Candidatus Hodarchaeota archaeon]
MNIVVIVAHPDDEVLGCGGTIARLARDQHEVYIAILGEGVTSRYHKREKAEKRLIQQLHARSHEVGRYLSTKEVFLFSLPDNCFDTVPLLDIIKIMEDLVSRLQPDVIYSHHGGDLNIDHQIVHRAVLTAARPLKNCPVKEIYAFEVPSSTEWAFQQFEPVFHPDVFVDITETLETKVMAMQLYESEVQPFPHPRSPEAIRAIAERWGSMVGLEAAEAFKLIRAVR